MKSPWFVSLLILVGLAAYFSYENERVEALPKIPTDTRSMESVPAAPALTKNTASTETQAAAPVRKKAKAAKVKVASKKKSPSTAASASKEPSKVSTREVLPKAASIPLFPHGFADGGKKPIDLKIELGEKAPEVEERRTMKVRTHQNLQQYRMVAVAWNF